MAAASRPCDHCEAVKRCVMFIDRNGRPIYLCRRCSRDLGYDKAVA